MKIKTSSFADVTVIAAGGRLDQDTAAGFQESLVAAIETAGIETTGQAGGTLVLELGAVSYISSIGLRALMVASKKGRAQKVTIRLANVSPFVQDVLEVSRFTTLFQSYPTVRDALAASSANAAAAFDAT